MNDSEATELSCKSHDNDYMANVVHCKNEYALSNQKKKIVATDYKQYYELNVTN